MKNFNNLKKHIESYYADRIKRAKKATRRFDSRGYNVEMTPAGLRAELKKLEKEKQAEILKLEKASQCDSLKSLEISIVWKKSAIWGYNPTAEVRIRDGKNYSFLTGFASGCGYDKESASIYSALAGNPIFNKFIFENYRKKGLKDTYPFRYGKNESLPSFCFSGCGISCLRNWAEKLGYKWHESHTKTSDFYLIKK